MKSWPDPRFSEMPLSRLEVFFVSVLTTIPQAQLLHTLLRTLIG